MNKLIVNQLPVETLRGQRVFVRIDIDGQDALAASVDDRKLLASLPTLEHLIGVGARIIIGTHLGDPRGEVVESLRRQFQALYLRHGRSIEPLLRMA